MVKIDFQAKTDRELLILVAQACNETADHLVKLNDKILKHEKRITALETISDCDPPEHNWKSTLKGHWQVLSILATLFALIIIKIAEKIS